MATSAIPVPPGQIIYGTNGESRVSVPNESGTEVSSIALSKGVWLIIACADWSPVQAGYRQIATNASVQNPSRYVATVTSGHSNKEVYQQASQILTIGEQTTLKLYAYQNSGNAIYCYPYFYAVRIA